MTTKSNAVAIVHGMDDFATFLTRPASQLSLDLSTASVIDVVKHYEEFKKRQNQTFDEGCLLSNLNLLQDAFHCTIMPMQINDIFYSYWMQFLVNKGCAYSTIQCYFDKLRAALRWSTRYHCPVSDTFDCYQIPKYSSSKIALSPDQISHIYHFNIRKEFKNNKLPPHIKMTSILRVRDMFVLACNLGQRYSDMVRIQPEHFDDTQTKFSIVQQKTQAKAVVDIPKMAIDPVITLEILRKYKFNAPYNATINTYNVILHYLLSKIGGQFKKIINTENKINGVIEVKSQPMHKLITSHTARRTFITNAIKRGIPEIQVRRASGHIDGRHFGTYCILD